MLEIYLKMLEEGYFEVQEAFKGLADEHVWQRPAEGLLSIGETAGHIAFWEAVRLAGEGGWEAMFGGTPEHDAPKCHVRSLLIDPRFRYQTTTLPESPSAEQQAMTAEQVCSELVRVHNESVAYFKALNPDLSSCPPGYPPNYTYRAFLTYAVFHIAYHTGQIYSARHLLGETTPDN